MGAILGEPKLMGRAISCLKRVDRDENLISTTILEPRIHVVGLDPEGEIIDEAHARSCGAIRRVFDKVGATGGWRRSAIGLNEEAWMVIKDFDIVAELTALRH